MFQIRNIEDVAKLIHMCECPKIHFYEVEFKLDGMVIVPSHKNCGDGLNEKQAETFRKELIKYWGFKDDDD